MLHFPGNTTRTRWLWRTAGVGLAVAATAAVFACSDNSTAPVAVAPPAAIPLFDQSVSSNGEGQCMFDDAVDAGYKQDKLQCVANDVDIGQADITHYCLSDQTGTHCTPTTPLSAGDRIACVPGQHIFAQVTAVIQNSAKERFDLGLWVLDPSLSGDANTGASCKQYNLIPLQNGAVNLDGDLCGDVNATTTTINVPLDELDLVCPSNGETTVTIQACAGWSNSTSGGNDVVCPIDPPGGPAGFRQGTTPPEGSKCKCNALTLPIDVKGVLHIKKVTIPSPDAANTSFTFTPGNWNGGTSFALKNGETKDSDPLSAGTYTAAETLVTGYTLSSRACVLTGTATAKAFTNITNGVSVSLTAGEDVTCTFTNTATASLAIQKQTIGGTATFGYTVSGTGLSPFSRNTATQGNPTTEAAVDFSGTQLADAKYVTETSLTGWTLTDIACTANGATIAIGTGQGASFAQGTSAGFDAGDNTVKVTLAPGSSPTCTFKNSKFSSLAIQKHTLGGTATFGYTVTGSGLSAFSRNTDSQGNPTTESAFQFDGTQQGEKFVSETALSGWTLTNITCTANGATILIGTGQGASFAQGTSAGYDQGDNTVKVTVASGDTPTCTFENTKNASLAIQKSTLGGTAAFGYTVSGTGLSAFSRNTTTQGNPTSESAFPFTGIQLGDKYVTETALAGWTLTNITCTASGATILIGTGQGASFVQGTSPGFDAGDNTVKVSVGAGNTPTCTFVNTKQGSITIVKDDKNPETDAQDFAFSATGTGMTPASFSLDDDADGTLSNSQAFTGLLPGSRSASETVNANWALTNISCTGATSSTIAFVGGNADAAFQAGDNQVNIGLAAGEDVTCTFTNQRKAQLIVTKTVVGGGTQSFDFSRTGISNFSLTNGGSNDSGMTLAPGNYTVCELTLAVSWAASATVDGNAATLANPDSPEDLGNRCVTVTLGYGDVTTVAWTNTPPPGGDARTIGYWKNWSSCTGGNQYTKALERGMLDKTLDGNLPQTIATGFDALSSNDFTVSSCEVGVSILGKSDINTGKKQASDACYNLAAQLLAAQLNYSAGAGQCAQVTQAITDAQKLLDQYHFDGSGACLTNKDKAHASDYSAANTLASLLDSYNNNTLSGCN